MNVIDRCWRRHPNWAANRQRLAVCSVGFAGKMRGNRGVDVKFYSVTDSRDDPIRPWPGTLRYGATLLRGKVWITFRKDMVITLKRPLYVKSFTTIDGRGANVQIAYGSGIVLQGVSNVIIHGLQIHNCRAQPDGLVVVPGGRVEQIGGADGDAIRLVSASKVWIDHNTLYSSKDGLLDVTRGSTAITISNNWFRDHDKVMLLGHDDGYVRDKKMQVTLAFNRFGPNCKQRMPRIRHGYAHIVNNFYDGWIDYAIGGSMGPSVKSQSNLFVASSSTNKKVTSRIAGVGSSWNWRSVGDAFINGASFKQSGRWIRPRYSREQSFRAESVTRVRALTRNAGAILCSARSRC
ncbi:pectate lyase 1-like isoform X2 [Carex rostrata]